MTDEEADALDELWTRITPEIDTSKPMLNAIFFIDTSNVMKGNFNRFAVSK